MLRQDLLAAADIFDIAIEVARYKRDRGSCTQGSEESEGSGKSFELHIR